MVDARLSVRLESAPARASLQPEGRPLAVEWDGEYAHVVVTTTAGHAMVVLDLHPAGGGTQEAEGGSERG